MEPQTAQSPSPQTPNLGTNLKRLRQEKGWNVQQLARESGLPQSTLSKVENSLMSLNFEKLLLVARTLQIDVARLFETEDVAAGRQIITGRRTLDDNDTSAMSVSEHYRFRHLSTGLKNRLMMPMLFEIGSVEPGQPIPMMDVVGERFAYVLEGPVEFHCEHYETVTLQTGESIYVDAAMPHAFVAPNGTLARVITVLTSKDEDYLELARKASALGGDDASEAFKRQRRG
ncbi:helix-turn-helix domain-containing protein [Pseudomaricurvus alkylphenolicus]|uniref:helix-turn-helix domain-containing protein n=1 Tax=Pseudomaricurvus alkylphenolicus TaxID=1306991 RepID=UPI00142089BD|nr:XRE family transcriptional regulator [Pseudomaricurvus alkylphenolicus]NIB43594.1 helix-turn-helix domain-containing protein [Pseudomaricurvus alkylphenolicus]